MTYKVTDNYRVGSGVVTYYHWPLDVVQHLIRSMNDPLITSTLVEKAI